MSERRLVSKEPIERAILVFRGLKVILDADLAALYGVTTKRFNEQVKRNRERFPPDFMFQLTREEHRVLRSHIATSSFPSHGGRRHHPYVFTEHGALMAASVLNSPRAIEMSILVVRAFVKLRSLLATHGQLAEKLDELERKLATHDRQIVVLFDAIRKLMIPAEKPARTIGFGKDES